MAIQELITKGMKFPVGRTMGKYLAVLGKDDKECRSVRNIGLEEACNMALMAGYDTIPAPETLKRMAWESAEKDRTKLKEQREKLARMTGLDADRWYGSSVYESLTKKR